MTQQQAFGTWASPFSAELVTTAGVRLGDVACNSTAAFWAETRPQDDGRCTIVKKEFHAEPIDIFAAPFNARTRVHEYGGGSWWVDDRYVYFVHWNDQRLYRVDHTSNAVQTPVPLTPEPQTPQSHRYADGCVSADGDWIVCVHESHDREGQQAQNQLIVIPNTEHTQSATPGESIKSIASGADFYSTPRFSSDGRFLSWIQWSHPQMPWDGTQLMLAQVQSDMSLTNVTVLSGANDISIMGAMWFCSTPFKDDLVYASDETGWWNLYQYNTQTQQTTQRTFFTDGEVGTPAWVFGTQRFVELKQSGSSLGRLAMIVTKQAQDQLFVLEPDNQVVALDTPLVSVSTIASSIDGQLVVHGQAATEQASINLLDPNTAQTAVLKPADKLGFDAEWISSAQAITYASGNGVSHAFFYPPAAKDITGSMGELPPLIVMGHGGPTSHSTPGLKLSIQYWTSRGIAVVDVNYGGSSGFGRDFRRLLNGQWGVVDVHDCIAAATHLASAGLVDAKRMVIRGGSAGGLTVLRALQTSQTFAGGTSLYGVTDLEMLAGDTHKFESRYLDGLLGGPYPEHKATYIERSPIQHSDKLSCPILVLQGDEDKVVPPNQSAAIVDAAKAKGLPHAYILFAGEQHGFRQTENIIRALKIELWFYGRVLGFTPSDDIDAPPEAVDL